MSGIGTSLKSLIKTSEKIDERYKKNSFSLANHLKQFDSVDLDGFGFFYADAKSLLRDMEYLESTIHPAVDFLLDMEKKPTK